MIQSFTFDQFSSRVLDVYNKDKDGFWSAMMAPFLKGSIIKKFFRHKDIGLHFYTLFKDTDQNRKLYLKDKTAEFGFDISQWKSLKLKDEYFTDAYPVYAFLVIWMHENEVRVPLLRYGDMLRAIMCGIAGYGLLDVIVDKDLDFSAVELLTAQYLISEYEDKLLDVFGVSSAHLSILHRIRLKYLQAEIKEKSLRFKASPYQWNDPIECGYKAAHLLTPFMCSLSLIGKESYIQDYFDIFFMFGAVIQILDDLNDLEDDLRIGHYSYPTLNTTVLEQLRHNNDFSSAADNIRRNIPHMKSLHNVCERLMDESKVKLAALKDPFLEKIVDITHLRMKSAFHDKWKIVTGEKKE